MRWEVPKRALFLPPSKRGDIIKSLLRLRKYAAKHKTAITFSFIFVFISALLSLLLPLVLKFVVDSLQKLVKGGELTKQNILFYSGIILSIAIVQGIFVFLARYILGSASRKIEYSLRNDFFAHLQKLSPSYYDNVRTGDIMARATNDLNAVQRVTGMAVMFIANTVVSFTVALIIMLKLDATLALLALLPFPVLTILIRELGKRVHKYFESIQEGFSDLSAKVQENLAGVRVVKAYTMEKSEIDEFKNLNKQFVDRNRLLIRLTSFFFPLIRLLPGIGAIAILWMGSVHVINGKITLGALVAFFAYVMRLTFPMVSLGWVINMFQQGAASMGRICKILDVEPDIKDDENILEDAEIQGEIEFRNLTFSYNSEPVLRNINLKIESGKTVAIVGGTGSGKSTLINLISRLYQVENGMLFIDGMDIRNIPLRTLRSNIGYVPQEPFLFSETIRENITFGVEKAGEDEVEEVARNANLLGEVDDFPAGFETELGERGVTISGGQKQRTAIARAILTKPKILILDDAFSSVDTHTEEEILTRLKKIMKDKTSVIISHRISTVKSADLIVVLSDGEIVERGTHDELLSLDGIYANLYQKQLLKEELDRL